MGKEQIGRPIGPDQDKSERISLDTAAKRITQVLKEHCGILRVITVIDGLICRINEG